ncbi:YaaA family protein [Arcobacter sp. FWKO B]|uniref:YaaA family protein n=1 Tax=Arcobacter sp. FWKO B TaxID=2593672 RepID=UPI0018A41E1E|nr:YaaA family protein [Arcobacter sp. FWKO B]QOG12289.1 YaaA family protein [Arcobacter sp. FWKO B]
MKILLAPSETKVSNFGENKPFCKENFSFEELFDKREHILRIYEEYLKKSSIEELSNWFGLKSLVEVEKYSKSPRFEKSTKAIQRYTGVAYEALGYDTLDEYAKSYIENNVVIFSNLFGAILAKDEIPDYKYKQGAKLPSLNIEQYMKTEFSPILDEYFDDVVVDLRAGYYEKFYTPKCQVVTYKFLKGGKVVSHWAKYYRGIVAKAMAQNNIKTLQELYNTQIQGLKIKEITESKNIKTIVCDVD